MLGNRVNFEGGDAKLRSCRRILGQDQDGEQTTDGSRDPLLFFSPSSCDPCLGANNSLRGFIDTSRLLSFSFFALIFLFFSSFGKNLGVYPRCRYKSTGGFQFIFFSELLG